MSHSSRLLPLTLALLLTAPAGIHAQELGQGGAPLGVTVQFIDDSYTLTGSTATEILAQFRVIAPAGYRSYQYAYSYNWSTNRIARANGTLSEMCEVTGVQFEFEITVRYPKWEPGPDASDEVRGAWSEFTERLELDWANYRDEIYARTREVTRRARRVETQCAFVRDEMTRLVPGTMREPSTTAEDRERVALRWPPEGYDELLRTEAAAAAGQPQTEAAPAPAVERERPSVRPSVTPAVDIDAAFYADTAQGRATGIVVDLHHLDQPQFREAYGSAEVGGTDPLDPEAGFGFVALTEVLLSTLVRSLEATGDIDADAPISTYLPDLSTTLGTVTLDQLLSHRSGLDHAMAPDSTDWEEVVDDLDDRALFAEPGAVFSTSRYSYPLAARVVSSATDQAWTDAISSRILEPLGLGSTSFGDPSEPAARDGLPVTHTNVADVTAFWTAWLAGEIEGVGPDHLDDAPRDGLELDGRTFVNGYWQDRIGEAPRLSLMCGSPATGHAAGFQVWPETRTIMVFWSRYDIGGDEAAGTPPSATRWPSWTVRFVLSRIAGALQLADEVYRPTALAGGGQPAQSARRCAEPAVSQARVTDFGPPADPGPWAGRYVNGEWFFQLRESEGRLVTPVDPTRAPYLVRHYGDDVYFTDVGVEGVHVGFPLRLFQDAEGRRYVMLGDRAYLHEEDRR